MFILAYSNGRGRDGWENNKGKQTEIRGWLAADGSQEMRSGQWATEPQMARVVDRIAGRLDFGRAIGNAVVPQVAEWIGRRIIEADAAMNKETF